jgi:RNA polymerase sigma-70 factor (ECF subfamily)
MEHVTAPAVRYMCRDWLADPRPGPTISLREALSTPMGGCMGKPTDGLVERARAGDEAAWGELYVAHAGRLVFWLQSLPTGDAASDYEDVAAEAWLTAARRIDEFTGNSSDFAGWLFGIARHLVWNQRRRTGRRATVPYAVDLADPGMWGLSDDETAADALGPDTVRRLLAHLPAREAEVVACLDVVGLDVAGTATALGITRPAVRVAHHRAITRLRRLLTPSEPAAGPAGQPTLDTSSGQPTSI